MIEYMSAVLGWNFPGHWISQGCYIMIHLRVALYEVSNITLFWVICHQSAVFGGLVCLLGLCHLPISSKANYLISRDVECVIGILKTSVFTLLQRK